jgi:hypothetical protein
MKSASDVKLSLGAIMLVLIFCAAMLLDIDNYVNGQAVRQMRLFIDDPRPLAKAAELLELRHGLQVTYEDAEYRYSGDVVDVTRRVVKPEYLKADSQLKKVFIPKGGSMDLTYEINAITRKPDNPGLLIQSLLNAHRNYDYPGVFSSQQVGKTFHIAPSQVKNESGLFIATSSPLDTLISLPEGEQTGLNVLKLLCEEINKRWSGSKVVLGTVPINLLNQSKVVVRAANEPARTVLLRAFSELRWSDPQVERLIPKKILSWQLFYGPDVKMYALNIHVVTEKAANPNGEDLRN